MSSTVSRREFVVLAPGVATALLGSHSARAEEKSELSGAVDPMQWVAYPRQDQKLVREIVGASHRDEARVRELVELKPALVNAWWDWGFGDWESPLGAASHVGRRSIAEFLIQNGARIDIFAAAMLGMTAVVKAFVAGSPGVQRTWGPHGIPLLAHAEAGGDEAKETAEYLKGLGDAGNRPATITLPEEDRQAYVGEYQFGAKTGESFAVKMNDRKQLMIERRDVASQQLHCAGKDEFFPAGVPSVRIKFQVNDGRAELMTIVEREPVFTAKRTGV